jgi:hypothetical protein
LPVGCAGGNSRLSAVRDHSVGWPVTQF